MPKNNNKNSNSRKNGNGNGRGRPELYSDRFPVIVGHLARLGITTNPKLAQALGIGLTSFKKYMRDYPEFTTAVQANKHLHDAEVEENLLMLCRGFEYEEVKVVGKPGKGDDDDKITRVEKTKKFVAPNERAIEFWLKNRRPEWRKAEQRQPEGEEIRSFEQMALMLARKRGANVALITDGREE